MNDDYGHDDKHFCYSWVLWLMMMVVLDRQDKPLENPLACTLLEHIWQKYIKFSRVRQIIVRICFCVYKQNSCRTKGKSLLLHYQRKQCRY